MEIKKAKFQSVTRNCTIIVNKPEMVEQHEPVPQHDGRKLLEHVVLEGHGGRQPARRDGELRGKKKNKKMTNLQSKSFEQPLNHCHHTDWKPGAAAPSAETW